MSFASQPISRAILANDATEQRDKRNREEIYSTFATLYGGRAKSMLSRFLAVLSCVFCSSLVLAEPLQLDASRVQWSQLEYRASILFMGLDATVELHELPHVPADEIVPLPDDAKGIAPASPSFFRLNINSTFLKQNNRNQLWFNPDGTALQRASLSTGNKLRYRSYRFAETGAYSLKRHPRSGEEKKPFQQWTDTAEDFYPYDATKQPLAITDSQALLYIASAAQLQQPGDSLSFAVFTKTGLGKATLTAQQRINLRVDFDEVTKQGLNSINGNVEVLKCTLTVSPLNSNDPVEDFDLLGLSGDLEIYLEPRRGIILQLSGRAKVIGSLDIKLQRAVLKR